MEIPEINMISDFEAGMKCLQNPSLISRFFSFPAKVPQVYSFWKWGALFFAIFATLNSLIKRLIKLVFLRFRSVKPQLEHIYDFNDDDDDFSLASSDDDDDDIEEEEEEEEEEEGGGEGNSPTTSFRGQNRLDEDFCVKDAFKHQPQNGHFRQRRRRCIADGWSEFTSGKSVVKLWDSLGLSLDFDEDLINRDSGSVVSIWDFDQDRNRMGYSGGDWNMPSVVLTEVGNGMANDLVLRGYDTRMRHRIPSLFAEWRSAVEEVGGVAAGGAGKVHVRDDVTGIVTVGDVRNVRVPLETVSESDGETWWDVEDEFAKFR